MIGTQCWRNDIGQISVQLYSINNRSTIVESTFALQFGTKGGFKMAQHALANCDAPIVIDMLIMQNSKTTV